MHSSLLKIILRAIITVPFWTQPLQAQDHGHLRIGATNTAQGTPLHFYNGPDFAAASGYIKTLVLTNGGPYSNYFNQNITFTVQAATAAYGGPEADAPALGSHIRAAILSVKGPIGGTFAFWETGATDPTVSLVSGETGTNSYDVTQTDGSPGVDPFGHIHGRRFTATKPGIYTVAFQAFDASTNGLNGGPIHAPSEIIEVSFQAGINIASLAKATNGNTVTFGSMAGQNFWLESSINLNDPLGWIPIAGPVSGNDYFLSLPDTNSIGQLRLYRLKAADP